jgi:hypothetical protein
MTRRKASISSSGQWSNISKVDFLILRIIGNDDTEKLIELMKKADLLVSYLLVNLLGDGC